MSRGEEKPGSTSGGPAGRGDSSAAFPKAARLLSAPDYQRVFADPLKSADRYFTVLARRTTLGMPRLGLAISKKCAKRAVDRNRIKRIVRESFRLHRREGMPALDLVVLCRRDAIDAPNERLFASLSSHWKNLRDQTCVGC